MNNAKISELFGPFILAKKHKIIAMLFLFRRETLPLVPFGWRVFYSTPYRYLLYLLNCCIDDAVNRLIFT